MPLTLLLAEDPRPGLVTFSNPASDDGDEDLLRGVASELRVTQRLEFPLPDASTRRRPTPPALLRRKHSDLWHGLTADERQRTVLITGPTAGLMAAPIDREVASVVALAARPAPRIRVARPWLNVLGAFPELDAIPAEQPPEPERDQWSSLVAEALARFDLLRSPDRVQVALEVGAHLGMGQKMAARVADAALAGARWDGPAEVDRDPPASSWLQGLLLAQSRSPTSERPKRLVRRKPS